jgi:signal transduction histidine kinase
MRFRDISIRRQLTTMTILSSVVGLVLSAAALILYAWSNARASFERDLEATAQIISDASSAGLVFGDRKAATETLAALRGKPEIESACLYAADSDGLFASYAKNALQACPPHADGVGLHPASDAQTLVRPMVLRGETAGMLSLTQTLEPLRSSLRSQVGITAAIMMVSFLISFGIAWRMQGRISRPIVEMAGTARRVSETGDYEVRVDPSGEGEVGRLVADFNHMLAQIGSQQHEIRRARDALQIEVREKTMANADLQSTLARLREAQAQLVQSEKLASLGALVAGVAHEINTPVGVGVTAASTLQAKAAQLVVKHKAGALAQPDIDRFVGIADESTRIILTNLERAANLIRSFKQVAVDQSSGERRRFGMKKYLEEVLVSLGPGLRKSGHTVTLTCAETLWADSYPGALAQIITNLISNSLIHAFTPEQRGRIDIAVAEAAGHVEVLYTDDGCGMPAENLARIFDPFFTTKRGSGGSGLGMHIVYNLVSQVLGGTITVASSPGHGARFTVRFPSGAQSQVQHERNIAIGNHA